MVLAVVLAEPVVLLAELAMFPIAGYPYAWARPLLSWHAIVRFRFPVQVSHQTQEPPFESLPATPGDITERLAAQPSRNGWNGARTSSR